MKDWKGIYIRSDFSGLCNRLRGLNALRAIAAYRRIPIRMVWKPNWACPGEWEDMFRPLTDVPMAELCPDGWFAIDGKGSFMGVKAGSSWKLLHAKFAPDVSRDEFRRLYVNAVRSVALSKKASDRLDQFSQRYDLSKMIGVHVRRTDLVEDAKLKWGVELRDDNVWRRMEGHLKAEPGVRFFLATDNPATEASYVGRFGDRVVVLPKRFAARKLRGNLPLDVRLTSMQDAVLDLYSLSLCRRIIGTSTSSFSQYAATLGAKPLEMA